MNRAVFLDRDGVVCKEKHLLHRKEDLELIQGSARAIKALNDNGYLVIIISNQPVVARGLCTITEIEEINSHLEDLIKKECGGHIDKNYYCPHHPKYGNDTLYTRECECRKPKPGMILQAQKDFKIQDLSGCYMVGDKTSDIKAGKLVGCKTILVKTGYGGDDGFKDAVPDYETQDLYEAVMNIITKKKK